MQMSYRFFKFDCQTRCDERARDDERFLRFSLLCDELVALVELTSLS